MASIKANIAKNLAEVRENVAAACARVGRDPGEVSIVAVTKAVQTRAVKAAVELGLTDLGENRVAQLVERELDQLG